MLASSITPRAVQLSQPPPALPGPVRAGGEISVYGIRHEPVDEIDNYVDGSWGGGSEVVWPAAAAGELRAQAARRQSRRQVRIASPTMAGCSDEFVNA